MRLRLFLVLVGLALSASPGRAGTVFVVDTALVDAADINPGDGKCEWATFPPVGQRCTLRAAVHEANALPGLDFIQIPNGWKITLSRAGVGDDQNVQGDLDIRDDVWITTDGSGLGPAVIDAAGIDRVFDVHSPAEVMFFNLVITGGSHQIGAGVNARSPLAQAHLSSCLLTGNHGRHGVALHAAGGTSSIADCTVEGNRNLTTSTASAVRRLAGGSLEVLRSTIAANPGVHRGVDSASLTAIRNSTIANGYSVGVFSGGNLILRNVTIYGNADYGLVHFQEGAYFSPAIYNSVIAGNGSPSFGADCSISTPGGFSDIAHPNLASDGSCGFSPAAGGLPNTDPLLGPLGPNGGPTQTMAPRYVGGTMGPVVDAGDNATCTDQDQRHVARPLNGDVLPPDAFADCDLGAVESLPCDEAAPGLFIAGSRGNGTTVACFSLVVGADSEIQAGATHDFRARQTIEIQSLQVLAGATLSIVLDPQAGSSVHPPW